MQQGDTESNINYRKQFKISFQNLTFAGDSIRLWNDDTMKNATRTGENDKMEAEEDIFKSMWFLMHKESEL